jgi:nicotinamidase-related amidase
MLASVICKILEMDEEIKGNNVKLDDLPKDKTVIVIVDMVKGFVYEGPLSSPRIVGIIDSIAELNKRAEGYKKIFFLDQHEENSPELKTYGRHALRGSSEDELISELVPLSEDANASVIHKNSTNGFHAPGFKTWLKGNEELIENYIVTGCEADICVSHFATTLKTYFNEKNLDRRIIVPINGVETYDYGSHDGELMKVISLWEMKLNGIEISDSIT